tara:strand:- start:29148 stop:29504 length:357 start_codon:yes stop_codon:yes gene_type:complete
LSSSVPNLNSEVRDIAFDRFAVQDIGRKLLAAHQNLYTDPHFLNRLHCEAISGLERSWIAREYAHQLGARPGRRGYFAEVARAYQALFSDNRTYSAIRDLVRSRLRTLDEVSGLGLMH